MFSSILKAKLTYLPSIAFFQKNREQNEEMAREANRGGAWSKLRKKFMLGSTGAAAEQGKNNK